MANKKITELPVANALSGAELIEVVQGGVNKQSTAQDITNLVTSARPSFSDWDASGDAMPTDSDAVGSGAAGAILKGDQVIFTVGGNIRGEDWPAETIGIAKQNSPTLDTHWRLY